MLVCLAELDARCRLLDIAVGNVSQFLDGHPVNVVN
jgi:hypothetical protein